MATYQTTYTDAPAIGLPGQVADEQLSNIISRTVEPAAGLDFGQPAFLGANDDGVIVTGSDIANLVGIAVLNRASGSDQTDTDQYDQYDTASLLTTGVIFVTAGEAVVPGDDVYWNSSTLRYTTTSGGNNVGPIPNAKFVSTGGNGDVAKVSINLA